MPTSREYGAPPQIKPKRLGDYLEVMSKAVFQAGISWQVVEAKWPTIREALDGFDAETVAAYDDERLDALTQDPRVIRSRPKLNAIVHNAQRIVGFVEKSPEPKCIPGKPGRCLASMGIYVFGAHFLFDQLCKDATAKGSSHDFGKNLIPSIIDTHRVFAFPFQDENRKSAAYWRDVGTIDAYYEANMDLISVDPLLHLYDEHWPIRTYQPNLPPPKFVFAAEEHGKPRVGHALDSTICQGSIVSGGHVERCIVGSGSRINSYSHVEDSILFEGVEVGRDAKVRRAIIDKNVLIPPGMVVGYDHDQDRENGLTDSSGGIVVIAKTDGLPYSRAADGAVA